ncbi:MAG TPA: hypothetical protein VFJ16_11865 [Longimicrobium sp.]|nr:hypothetical protein [Longimicrobium sp.]
MFEMTMTLDDVTLVKVTYHVHLRLFERDRFFGHAERVRRMHAIMNADELWLIPTIEAIVGEIEQDAGAPLESLSDIQLRDYIRLLEDISDARTPPSTPEVIERAQRHLEEIRREFGYAA